MTKILTFSGSSRRASLNSQLAAEAARVAARLGAEAKFVDFADFDMPIYNGDLEDASGVPDGARRFRDLLSEHDGYLVACPEYNGSITPLLKNAIDWTSRPDGEVPALVGYRGKIAGLLSASPGGLGGIRGLAHVRTILSGIGVHVVPTQFALGGADSAFADDGSLQQEAQAALLEDAVAEVVRSAERLKA